MLSGFKMSREVRGNAGGVEDVVVASSSLKLIFSGEGGGGVGGRGMDGRIPWVRMVGVDWLDRLDDDDAGVEELGSVALR